MPGVPPIGKEPLILVVDDVEANRSVVCRRLDGKGYVVEAVESGEKALRFIEDRRPDLVLLDYMMPTMNGIEVLNVIRDEWKMTDLPVIMLTARAEAEAVVAALEAGADDYISKPIDFEVLRARIETQLTKGRSKDGLLKANAALDERMAIRVLAFDQIREELEREIALRKNAEREYATLAARETPGVLDPAWEKSLTRAIEIVDVMIDATSQGRPPNLALLHALRAQLAPDSLKSRS